MNIGEYFYCSKCMRELEDDMVCPYCGHDPDAPVGRGGLEEGTLLNYGRYQLGAVLGVGGFGITYAAWDYTLEQPVAIKEYFPQLIAYRDNYESNDVQYVEEDKITYLVGLQRFSREARVLSTLQNIKAVVSVLDCFEANQTAYIAMEFVRGKTIEEYVKQEQPEPKKIIELFRDLIDSLVLIHAQGVLHRDISPSNIMVEENGTLKLIDFGAATVEKRKKQGLDQTVVFNRQFAPIEQYDENGEQGAWTDVYALSTTLYYLISGELPQEALARKGKDQVKSLKFYDLHLKKWQEQAIAQGMEILPEKRIRSMEHFRSVLYHLPLPEEIKRRRIFVRKVITAASVITGVVAAVIINAMAGFPLKDGICFGLRMDGWHILGYAGNRKQLEIPSDIMGIPVAAIGQNSFEMNQDLAFVMVPETVESIESGAFSGCQNLISVELSEGIDKIGGYAFSDCKALRYVLLPESLREISSDAFNGNSAELVVFCKDNQAIQNQLSESGVAAADYRDYVFTENDEGVVITDYQPQVQNSAVTVPEYAGTKKVIGFLPETDHVLFDTSVTEIHIPESIEELETGIVNGNTALETISVGKNLKTIGDYALFNAGMGSMELPEGLERIGEYAFAQSFLTEIDIPDTVTDIGKSAFSSCVKLKTVKFPDGISAVAAGMFEGCTSLSEVELPDTVESLELLSFSRCSSLKTFEIPKSVTRIGGYAFSECVNLQVIYIPAAVTEIAATAFDGCSNDLVIAGMSTTVAEEYAKKHDFAFLAMDQWNWDTYGVSDTGGLIVMEGAREESVSEMPSVYAGSSSKIISVLDDARKLKGENVILPEYITEIWGKAFCENQYIKEVHSFESLKKIGTMAFAGCRNLEQIDLTDGLENIGSFAFAGDDKMNSVELPDTLEQLGMNAFAWCSNLKEIRIPENITVLNNGVFAETAITQITIPGNVTKCRTSFYGCSKLVSAVIDEGVRTLWGTFAGCDHLKTVIVPSSMEQISASTFQGCSNLTDIYIYSRDVDLDFIWPGGKYVYEADSEGNVKTIQLETNSGETDPLFSDSPRLTIHGYRGSTAQAYAQANGIKFELITE